MKILYIAYHGNKCDWLADSLLHGLLSLNYNVEHFPVASRMYFSHVDKNKDNWMFYYEDNHFRTIKSPIPNYDNIEDKIMSKYYELIIYGCYNFTNTFDDIVKKIYNKSQIIFIDGADHDNLNLLIGCLDKGILFKREIAIKHEKINPISFAYPIEKVFNKNTQKININSGIIPGDYSTYIKTSPLDYVNRLQSSLFSWTWKKGGWDCMRHYDIIFNKCLPLFKDIESCPSYTMVNHRKDLYIKINNFYEKNMQKNINEIILNKDYIDISNEIFDHACNHLSTKSLAKYVMSKI